jgi:hypothetical protein
MTGPVAPVDGAASAVRKEGKKKATAFRGVVQVGCALAAHWLPRTTKRAASEAFASSTLSLVHFHCPWAARYQKKVAHATDGLTEGQHNVGLTLGGHSILYAGATPSHTAGLVGRRNASVPLRNAHRSMQTCAQERVQFRGRAAAAAVRMVAHIPFHALLTPLRPSRSLHAHHMMLHKPSIAARRSTHPAVRTEQRATRNTS